MFSSLTTKLSAVAAVLTLLTSTASAADFTNYPMNSEAFYGNLYSDSWGARSALCTPGASGVDCNGGNCDVTVGQIYARFEGPDFDTAMKVCWDAYNDIVNNGIYKGYSGGDYNYNGVYYKLEIMPQQPPQ